MLHRLCDGLNDDNTKTMMAVTSRSQILKKDVGFLNQLVKRSATDVHVCLLAKQDSIFNCGIDEGEIKYTVAIYSYLLVIIYIKDIDHICTEPRKGQFLSFTYLVRTSY